MKYELIKVKCRSGDVGKALLAAPHVPHIALVITDTTMIHDS
jgi:hypothetical protein